MQLARLWRAKKEKGPYLEMTAGVELVSAGPPQARRALAVRALVYAVALIVAVVALVGSSGAVAPAGLLSWSTAFDDGYAYLFTDLLARRLLIY